MGVKMGVEPDQTDGALLGDGLGGTLPGSDGAAVVASKHQRLVAPADAFGNRCREALCVISDRRGGGYGTRTTAVGPIRP